MAEHSKAMLLFVGRFCEKTQPGGLCKGLLWLVHVKQ